MPRMAQGIFPLLEDREMNKVEELRVLEEAANKLDPLTTYSGAWLREQLPAIRMAMDSDLLPSLAAVSYAEAVCVVEEARLEARKILAKAEEEVKAKKEESYAALVRQADRMAYALNSAAKKLWETMP